jgi:uncharacterized protein (UPF0276 family)
VGESDRGRKADRIEGVGLSLRTLHYGEIEAAPSSVPWFEVISDNYAHGEGPPLEHLERVRAGHPIVLHGVGMSLGSTDPLDSAYLGRIRALAHRFEPAWISEHLAWTSVGGSHFHELLPVPWNEEAVRHFARRIGEAQNELGQRLVVENAVTYLAFEQSTLSEVEFINAVLEEADCELLLDVNNVYVNAINHGFDPEDWLRAVPPERVRQMHLAGHDDHGRYLIDAHGSPVSEPVWELFELAVELFPGVPTCIEWDRDVPSFEVLLLEMKTADARARAVSQRREAQGAA